MPDTVPDIPVDEVYAAVADGQMYQNPRTSLKEQENPPYYVQ